MSEKRKRLVDTVESALDRLDAALQRPKDEFMRDSAIQRFEFTFELLRPRWGSRATASFWAHQVGTALGILADSPQWFRMLEHRNLTSHTYNVATAEAIYASLPDYSRMMREALRAVRDRG